MKDIKYYLKAIASAFLGLFIVSTVIVLIYGNGANTTQDIPPPSLHDRIMVAPFLIGEVAILCILWLGIREGLKRAAVILVIVGVFTFILANAIPDSMLYAAFYHVSPSRIHVDKQPADCNWGHAPIGDKDCHYTKNVDLTTNDKGKATDVYVTWHKAQD